jgi:acyl carrier protein
MRGQSKLGLPFCPYSRTGLFRFADWWRLTNDQILRSMRGVSGPGSWLHSFGGNMPLNQTLIELVLKMREIARGMLVPEASLSDDLGFDSLDQVELFHALEDALGIENVEQEAANQGITKLGQLQALIDARLQPGH